MTSRKFHPHLDDAEALKTFQLARRFADIVFECLPMAPTAYIEDHRSVPVAPYMNRRHTVRGLLMELRQGDLPVNLITPWGLWWFGGTYGGNIAELLNLREQILARVETSVYKAAWVSKNIEHGPILGLIAVDGERLPKPQLATEDEYPSPEDAERAWESLSLL